LLPPCSSLFPAVTHGQHHAPSSTVDTVLYNCKIFPSGFLAIQERRWEGLEDKSESVGVRTLSPSLLCFFFGLLSVPAILCAVLCALIKGGEERKGSSGVRELG